MKTKVSIRRPDGIGYQLLERLLTKKIIEKNCPELLYVNTRMNRAGAHLREQECIDYLFKEILGVDNICEYENENEIHMVGNTWSNVVKTIYPEWKSKDVYFIREWFNDVSTQFVTKHENKNIFTDDSSKKNVVIQVRRGDVMFDKHPRLMTDENYIELLDKLRAKISEDVNVYIETDSPGHVKDLQKKIHAKINITSDETEQLKSQASTAEWKKSYNLLQSLYNMASCDYLIPSKSCFSRLGYVLGKCELFTGDTRTKRIDLDTIIGHASHFGVSENDTHIMAKFQWIGPKFIESLTDIKCDVK